MFKIQSFDNKTLSWWHKQSLDIDFKPVFQRHGRLWSPKDKTLFVDSILNGFDVPKFYIADFRYSSALENPSKKPYAIVDGKQRLETIFEFFDGLLKLANDFKFLEAPDMNLEGASYKDLVIKYPEIASRFSEYIPNVMSIITDEEGKINELFVRLNRSKPLTGAEVRNAMPGEVPKIVRKLSKHRFFSSCIGFTTKRYQDRNAAAKLLLIEFNGRLIDTKKRQLDSLTKELKTEGYRSDDKKGLDRAVQLLTNNLNLMADIFNKKDSLLSSQGPITLYYWFIRKHGSRYAKVIRDFLFKIEAERKENHLRDIRKESNVDQEMITLSFLKRSPNDQGSVTRAFGILENRFLVFLKNKHLIIS
jgi:hypothetical protein